VGGHAHFVWWAVIVREWLRCTACHSGVVGVGTPCCWWVDGGQLLSFVPILCHCSWV